MSRIGGGYMERELVNYPYKGSQRPGKMSRYARAAQFSPFAALTGYDGLLAESSRLTEERIGISEDRAERINESLRIIAESYPQRIGARITYFVPDKNKSGGAYETAEGLVRQINEGDMTVVFADGRAVRIDDIFDIEL